jgi:hypothetical protein
VSDDAPVSPQPVEAYRAIGEYVVSFSQLVYAMRSAIENRLMSPANGYHLIQLAIGEAPAYQIANSFFGMCSEEARLEHKDDRKIGSTLKANVLEEITRRNDISHGDWWVWAPERSTKLPNPTLVRLKPGRGNFPERPPWRGLEEELADQRPVKAPRTVESYTIEGLDKLSASVLELARVTAEFGGMCLAARRPGDRVELRRRFVVVNKRVVVRDSPKISAS